MHGSYPDVGLSQKAEDGNVLQDPQVLLISILSQDERWYAEQDRQNCKTDACPPGAPESEEGARHQDGMVINTDSFLSLACSSYRSNILHLLATSAEY